MSSQKQQQQLSSDELLAQLDELSVENTNANTTASSPPAARSQTPTITTTMNDKPADAPAATSASTSSPAPPAATANATTQGGAGEQSGNDLIAELSNLAAVRPSSRTTNKSSPDSAGPSTRASTDEKRLLMENSRAGDATSNTATSATAAEPSVENKAEKGQSGNGNSSGWWGGIFATASAAVKQAEAAVKDIQNNEETQKWTEQVKGRVGGLRGLGDEIRTLAMPTFTSLIHTLAPPISSHERLQIHTAHDFHGYPSLDPLIYSVFSRIMSQVEGGDLIVIQRSQEAPPPASATNASSDPKNAISSSTSRTSTAGWNDGPWWRTVTPGESRCINSVKGPAIATKLARANVEDYAKEYFAARGGIELVKKQTAEIASASNPVRTSDIFLALQAIDQPVSDELFQANRQGKTESSDSTDTSKPKQETPNQKDNDHNDDDDDDESANREVSFAIYLHDPIHNINFSTISQAIPQKWIEWFDSPAPPANLFSQDDEYADDAPPPFMSAVPDDILEIIEQGGVDPREWASEWLQETILLAVGVVAQRYVARRMGVGEPRSSASGPGQQQQQQQQGKMKAGQAPVVDSGAGEAARAL